MRYQVILTPTANAVERTGSAELNITGIEASDPEEAAAYAVVNVANATYGIRSTEIRKCEVIDPDGKTVRTTELTVR